jgi:hypothetical protein
VAKRMDEPEQNYNEWIAGGWSKLLRLEPAVVAEHQVRGLGHVDDLSEFNCPVGGRRRFFSKQFDCNPQRVYLLFYSQHVLLFHSENFKRILHG